jgi:DNA polymerase III subunit beta
MLRAIKGFLLRFKKSSAIEGLMKFSISRDRLYQVLQKVYPVVEKRNSVQVLGELLLSLKGGRLSVGATDLEVGLRMSLEVDRGSEEGEVSIPAHHFFAIVRELPKGKTIHLLMKDHFWMSLECESYSYKIAGRAANQHPLLVELTKDHEENFLPVKAEALIEMIRKTAFSIATDSHFYQLNGVFCEPTENATLRMVSTDLHRMSFIERETFLNPVPFRSGVIIPKKGLSELHRMLNHCLDTKQEFELSLQESRLAARASDFFLSLAVLQGDFFNYQAIMPKKVKHEMILDRERLTDAIRLVHLLSHEKSHAIQLEIEKDKLSIQSSRTDIGEASAKLQVSYEGEPVRLALNAKYLLEYLETSTAKEIEIGFSDARSPFVLKDQGESSALYLVQPMRL